MTISVPGQNSELPLDRLPPGTCAVVRRLNTAGEEIQRLKMLGVCVGRRVEVIKTGDPLIIRVFNSRIGISASLAACVTLQPCGPDHCALHSQPVS